MKQHRIPTVVANEKEDIPEKSVVLWLQATEMAISGRLIWPIRYSTEIDLEVTTMKVRF